jgi:hypothetical protein
MIRMGFLRLFLGLMNFGVRLGGMMPEIDPARKAAGFAVAQCAIDPGACCGLAL